MNSRPERRRCIRELSSSREMSSGEPPAKKQCDTTQQPLNLADLSSLPVRALGFYRETIQVGSEPHSTENEVNIIKTNQNQNRVPTMNTNNDSSSSPDEDANPHIRFASNEELHIDEPSTSKEEVSRGRSKNQKSNVAQPTQTSQVHTKLTRRQKEELLNNPNVVFGVLNFETNCLALGVDQFPTCVCLTVKNEHVQQTTLHYRPLQSCSDCCHNSLSPQPGLSNVKMPPQAHATITVLAREIVTQLYEIVRQGNVGSVSGSILLPLPSPLSSPTPTSSPSEASSPTSTSSTSTVTLSVTATVTTVAATSSATVSLVNSKTFSKSITSTNAGSYSHAGNTSQLDLSVEVTSPAHSGSSQHFVPPTHMIPPSHISSQTHVVPQPHMIHPSHMGIPSHVMPPPHIAPPAHMGHPSHLIHPPHMGQPGQFVNPNHIVQQAHLIQRAHAVPTSRGIDMMPPPSVVPSSNIVCTSHAVTSSYMGPQSHVVTPAHVAPPPTRTVPSYTVPTSQGVSSYMVPISRELSPAYMVSTSHGAPTTQSAPTSNTEVPKTPPIHKLVPARIIRRRQTIYPGEREESNEQMTPGPSRRNDGPYNMSGGAVSLIQEPRNFAIPNSTMVQGTPAPPVPRVSTSPSVARPRQINFRRSTVTGAAENMSSDEGIPRSQHRQELLQYLRNQANFEHNQMRINPFPGIYNQDHFQNSHVHNFPLRSNRYFPGASD